MHALVTCKSFFRFLTVLALWMAFNWCTLELVCYDVTTVSLIPILSSKLKFFPIIANIWNNDFLWKCISIIQLHHFSTKIYSKGDSQIFALVSLSLASDLCTNRFSKTLQPLLTYGIPHYTYVIKRGWLNWALSKGKFYLWKLNQLIDC